MFIFSCHGFETVESWNFFQIEDKNMILQSFSVTESGSATTEFESARVLLNDPGISCLEPSSVSTIKNYLVLVENIIGHSCTSWIGPGNPETKYRNDKIADANRNLSYIIYRLYSYWSITPIFF